MIMTDKLEQYLTKMQKDVQSAMEIPGDGERKKKLESLLNFSLPEIGTLSLNEYAIFRGHHPHDNLSPEESRFDELTNSILTQLHGIQYYLNNPDKV